MSSHHLGIVDICKDDFATENIAKKKKKKKTRLALSVHIITENLTNSFLS